MARIAGIGALVDRWGCGCAASAGPSVPEDVGSRASDVAYGRQAIVLNVFVEKGWRRRGVAARLMESILEWGREERLESLVLHASPDGRSLYEQLGFVATNEMRYSGDLAPPPPFKR